MNLEGSTFSFEDGLAALLILPMGFDGTYYTLMELVYFLFLFIVFCNSMSS